MLILDIEFFFKAEDGIRDDTKLGNLANLGLEGVAYDWGRDVYYGVKEKTPMEVYIFNFSDSNAPTTTLFNATQVFNGTQGTSFTDLSSIAYDNNTDTLFILSHESQALAQVHRNGTIIRNITLDYITQAE